mgnify:CR=1 FL=1
MVDFCFESSAEPLTDEEIKWCKSLEKLLMKTPKRFGLFTIGDADLGVYDQDECIDRGVDEDDLKPIKAGLGLATIHSNKQIGGWCG